MTTHNLPPLFLRLLVVGVLAWLLLFPELAWAVDATDDFKTVVDDLTDWIQGGLGVTISLSAVIVGALVSIVRSNPLPILAGIAFAMILNFTPTIIAGIITVTL